MNYLIFTNSLQILLLTIINAELVLTAKGHVHTELQTWDAHTHRSLALHPLPELLTRDPSHRPSVLPKPASASSHMGIPTGQGRERPPGRSLCLMT